MRISIAILLSIFFTVFSAISFSINAQQSFVNVVKTLKPSVVGVGIYDPLASPRSRVSGTGFVVGNGQYIATNFHVTPKLPSDSPNVSWVVFTGEGKNAKVHKVEVVAKSEKYDLAILKLKGDTKLKPAKLANGEWVEDATSIAFTGFPIGSVLGLYPVTHQGIISARTPAVIPAENSQQLSLARLKLLRDPYFTYQLDATAYPGNSGSPVYLRSTGEIIAIVNKVFVKKTKEEVLSDPSDITYAIPVKHLHTLLDTLN